MLLLRNFPDVRPIPETAAFRAKFYAVWGKEHCLVSARARRAEYPPFVQRLSIKAAWGGAERYFIDGRSVAVDTETYLILNDCREYASALVTSEPVHSFSIFFQPGFAEETLGALLTPADRWLESGSEPIRRSVEFAEHLRAHDRCVSPVLRFIALHVDQGIETPEWYEEQLSFLLERMLIGHRIDVSNVKALPAVRAETRREIYRRIGWATDYVYSNYCRTVTIDAIAEAAHLSKYHLIRLFSLVHGVTPYAFLQRTRAAVAERLLRTTRLSQKEIALRSGFDHRATMFRQLVRWTGSSASAHRVANPAYRHFEPGVGSKRQAT